MYKLNKSDIERFWKYVDQQDENNCWNWLASYFTDGYGQFKLKGKMVKSHRIALFLAHLPQNKDCNLALHTCKKNRKCCNPSHLYWGTHQQNMDDRARDGTGRSQNGELNNQSKLTDCKVKEIKQLLKDCKMTQTKIGQLYNVSSNTISRIKNGKSWKHVLVDN